MRNILILLLGLFLISFASAGLLDNYQVNVNNIGTSNEDLTLTTSKGEINTYLVRESNLLNRWIRVRGMFYSEHENKLGKKIKFGNSDSDVAVNFISKYRYYFVSTMPYYEKEGFYFFYDGNESNKDGFIWIDLNDICSRTFSNGSVLADCKITMEKKNRILLPDQYIIMVEFNSDRNIDPNFAGGTGTSIDPYQITNWTALQEINNCLNCYYVLNNSLNSSTSDYTGIGDNWQPIGNSTAAFNFVGEINGQGYTISDLVVKTNGTLYRGFIGYSTTGMVIRNVNFNNASVTSGSRAGIVVGSGAGDLYDILINNSKVTGTGSTNADVGGLIGYHGGTTGTKPCYNISVYNTNVTHTNGQYTGGLIGRVGGASAKVEYSFFEGIVAGQSTTGGLVGSGSMKVNKSYFKGIVSGTTIVGGLVGNKAGASTTYQIIDCWVEGIVSGNGNYIGGGVGQLASASFVNNLTFNGSVQGVGNVQGVGGLVGSMTTSTTSRLDNSKAYGIINCSSSASNCYVGGLAGIISGIVTYSYSNMSVYGNKIYVGCVGGNAGSTHTINHTSGDCNVYCSSGATYCGGFIGFDLSFNSVFNNLSSTATIYSNVSYVGGLFGFYGSNVATLKPLYNSYYSGNIYQTDNSKFYVGGLFGNAYSLANESAIFCDRCFSNGTIYNAGNTTGGLIAYQQSGTIRNSYSNMNIVGTNFCGGAIANTSNGTESNVSRMVNIYSRGLVNCSGVNVGGLIGLNTSATYIENSYWDTETSTQVTSSGGQGYTTSQMKDINNFANWSISGTSIDLNNGYPYLAWQGGVSGTWLIYNVTTPSNCWNRVGNSLLITIPCAIPIGETI